MTKLFCFQLYSRLLGAALCGALATFAFAPYEIWWLAILSPCLLFALLEGARVKHSLLIGYAWGLGFFGVGIRWVHISIDTFGGLPKIVSLLLMGLLVGYLAIYHALFAGLLNRFFIRSQTARWLLAAPVIWLLTEWLRGWIMTGFPWLWLGYSQLASPLSAFAPLAGVELVSGLVLFCSGALYLCWYRKTVQPLLGLILVFALGFMLNRVEWVTPQPDRSAKVALIQGNVSQAMKWLPHQRWPTIMKYTDLSRENWNADLIIWPEAAIPAFESEISSFLYNIDQAARLNHTAIITGVLTQTQDKRFYNSILTLGNNLESEYSYQPEQRYHKHHLLPFGEFVPFAQLLRPLAPLFNLPMSSFSSGAFIQPNLTANGFTLIPALCYEIAFNEQLRSNTHADSDFILTLSNDAWFGDSIGPWQHMEIARMRALELGKPLIRATNNGVTAVTDHNGNIVAQLPQFTTGVLKAQLTPTHGQTPYQKYGSYPLYLLLLICLAAAIRLNRRFRATLL